MKQLTRGRFRWRYAYLALMAYMFTFAVVLRFGVSNLGFTVNLVMKAIISVPLLASGAMLGYMAIRGEKRYTRSSRRITSRRSSVDNVVWVQESSLAFCSTSR